MKYINVVITTCLVIGIEGLTKGASTTVTEETINTLIKSPIVDSNRVMATSDGLLRIFTVLSTAGSLAVYFFKYFFGFIFHITIYAVSPFLWTIKFCWHQFVTKPFDLLVYIFNILYPVLMFFLAAICCGVFIGGCAGFAAEAFSTILISATWGPQSTIEQQQVQEDLMLPKEIETEDECEQESFHEKRTKKKDDSRSSSISSFLSKGDSWRDSFSSATSSSTNNNPVLIRRMKLSSTESSSDKQNKRKNSWDWDEDDE